jgi:hypothetical protein
VRPPRDTFGCSQKLATDSGTPVRTDHDEVGFAKVKRGRQFLNLTYSRLVTSR